jgi:hypothetical protein
MTVIRIVVVPPGTSKFETIALWQQSLTLLRDPAAAPSVAPSVLLISMPSDSNGTIFVAKSPYFIGE